VSDWNDTLSDVRTFLVNVGVILLVAAAVALIAVAIPLVWRRRRTYRVVLVEARNGSGVKELDAFTLGFSELLRQELGDQLGTVRDQVLRHQARFQVGVPKGMRNERLPDAKADETVQELTKSIQEAAGKASGVLQLSSTSSGSVV
jgi:hypothetical protein